MIIQLKSALHTEEITPTINSSLALWAHHSAQRFNSSFNSTPLSPYSQIIEVLTGGTEGLFVEKVETGEIDLTKPIYLVASGQSNSLAASLEILSYINQHNGKGEILC